MLSFVRGKPIGFVEGGEHDKKVLYRVDDLEEKDKRSNPVLLLGQDYFMKLRKEDGGKIKRDEMTEIIDSLMALELPENKSLHVPYTKALDRYTDVDKKEIALKAGKIHPLPDFELEEKAQRENYFLAGPSGAGKSYLLREICDRYRDDNPDKVITVFSRVADDPAFDGLEVERKKLDAEFVKSPPAAEDFKDQICVFDDIDTIQDKKLLAAILGLRDDILETGRHNNTTVISTSHLLLNYKKTRTSLNEATHVVFYPQAGSKLHIKRYLKDHASLEPAAARKIINLPSRWVMHCKTVPQCFIHEKGAIMVKGL